MAGLTKRQLLTIKHLKDIQGITSPTDIIKWAIYNLSRPKRYNHRHTPKERIPGRKHPKAYYQEIINFYETKST